MVDVEVRIPSDKSDVVDAYLALCVLRKLPEYTRALKSGSSSTSYRVIDNSISAARWYYRRYSKYEGFIRLLNAYMEAVKLEAEVTALEKAYEIAEQCELLPIPQLCQRIPTHVVLVLVLSAACSLAVVIVVSISLGRAHKNSDCSCSSSGTRVTLGGNSENSRRERVAAIVLSAISLLCCFVIFPLLYTTSARAIYSSSEKLADKALQLLTNCEKHEELSMNPLSETSEIGDGTVVGRNAGFLIDKDTAVRNRKSITTLLTEATEDEGDVVLRSRGLPPVAVSLSAFYRNTIIIMTNNDGQIVMWSDGAAACLGFSARDTEGNNINTLLYGEKSVEQYATMRAAAAKNLDLSEKTLTLAHISLGSISISGTVVGSRDAETNEHLGYTLIGSVRFDELSQTQALFHSFFVAELLQMNLKNRQARQILDCLQLKNLRDFSALARDWNIVHIRRLLADVIKDRHRFVNVDVDPKVNELPPILCDAVNVTSVLNRVCDLFTKKIRIRVEQKSVTSAIYQLVVTFHHDMAEVDQPNLSAITRSVNDLGGMLIDLPGRIQLCLPFMTKDEGIQALTPQEIADQKSTGHDPFVVLLLEKNALHRHNISAAVWNYGHSLRLVDNVRKALEAIEDSTNIGCAIVDVDAKGSDRVIEGLLSKQIYTIETSEVSDGVVKRGDALLTKPLSNDELLRELNKAEEKVEEAKRAEEQIVKQRRIFEKVRKEPWEKGRLLGRGGFATVYEATSTLTSGKMAVKMIRVSGSFEEHIDAFLNEIEILCKLTHPNIIHYFYCERAETTLNLFMELADQGTVADLLLRCPRLPENHVATIAKQLLQAVKYLHESGIVHRDIKPGNILISQGQLKLSDFGTATSNINMEEGTVGTITYMAPEVVDGKAGGKESDIWSIGCVVCECLQVKRPGGGLLGYGAPKEFPSDISANAIDFIKACMHTNPVERATAGTLLLHNFIVHLDHEVSQLAEVPPEAAANDEAKPLKDESASSVSGAISWSFD
ncbi:mitogen activated kinase-like protein [Leptomonas pyrrhocoris]|uniref:Mitogen activated kinase-like protein n=1 Tax=Leptomonas pyrrhocoris TaxID=157538 RepID=A0A0M9G3B1_LEPPY|nr:mitogen activated kinase-like protein [Leptomonas pyrrhocoris]KPA81383.1 mitogen activated kinase-like protein [Leptomonas pyrrhocoris]|eukprot:XP_015659822.1 mitogen activated kinase-like protein [Leptomonas pyrrhocoris]